jgi:S1-C subfamily serine protease
VKLVPCGHCGQAIKRNRDVCPFCGAAVVRSPPLPPRVIPASRAATEDDPAAAIVAQRPLWKRANVIIPLVVGVAFAVILLAIGLSTVYSKLTPQEIYQKHVESVVEIETSFPGTYDILGQQTGGGQALGTGFVVSKDGYILTNAHVVSENGQAVGKVTVIFNGNGSQGARVDGIVVSADESTDVALVKVDPGETPRLVPIPLGDSSKATVGEAVVAIGNPLGLDSSLSLGVVSATNRELQSPNGATITGGIQTDASINPGNSGGPLIDSTGHVIGINEQIDTYSGGNEGIGFAVPINTAIRVMQRMVEADALAQ